MYPSTAFEKRRNVQRDIQRDVHRDDSFPPHKHQLQCPWRSRLAAFVFFAAVCLLVRQYAIFSVLAVPLSWFDLARAGEYNDGFRSVEPGSTDEDGYLLQHGLDSGPEPAITDSIIVKRQESTSISSAPPAAPTVLNCFQVAQPVLSPEGAHSCLTASGSNTDAPVTGAGDELASAKDSCSVVLMEHSFALSYDKPFVGNYTPPSCQFNRVVMNFTVVSEGRQFDRLALMYFGDTEVWRTSTAEPTSPPGIRWVYLKDMTHYLYFWKSPQKLIFDLGNLIDDTYTGPFNTTLTATFFNSDAEAGAAPPSDLIIPISKRQGGSNKVSHFALPLDDASNTIEFPRNAHRAVFSVSACGQADEEFWWSNVLQSDVYTFNATAGELPGLSPFREVQVLIDGKIAGVQWPFPVIFTGGVVPSLHRPIVGLDAFDLREHEIDITPFLALLSDGNEHIFAIRVAGLNDDGKPPTNASQAINSNWYVTGKIFVWLDEDEKSITTGDAPTIQAGDPTVLLSRNLGQASNGTNETLTYSTNVQRSFSVTARVVSQKSERTVSWSQTLSYSNEGSISHFGFDQVNNFLIQGSDRVEGSDSTPYRTDYRYPLFSNSTYSISNQGNMTLQAHLVQGLRIQVQGPSVFPTGLEAFSGKNGGSSCGGGGDSGSNASLLSTTKEGTASFFQSGDGKNSSGFGDSSQVFRFGRAQVDGGDLPTPELYFRNVSAVNGSIAYDQVRVVGREEGEGQQAVSISPASAAKPFAQAPLDGGPGPRAFMGRTTSGRIVGRPLRRVSYRDPKARGARAARERQKLAD